MPTELLDDFNRSENPYGYKVCYSCGDTNYTKVTDTFWGGMLGPKILNHVKCNNCSTTYNGKTGLPNKQAIAIYLIVFSFIGFAVGGLVISLL